MITINLSDKQAATLKQLLSSQPMRCSAVEFSGMVKDVCTQISNQQFDVSDFESSRQYESLSIESVGLTQKTELYKSIGWIIKESSQNEGYLTNWDDETNK
ncbi:hypothetical protein [Escherichia phage IMM-001]|nr:hypothetical protein [Escherichia phage IMM-001]